MGFTDVGTAWSGTYPWDNDNSYNKQIIENNPIRIIIHKNRSPVIIGYGFGLRSTLLGYFIRLDWAWGVENGIIRDRMFYFSLSLDL